MKWAAGPRHEAQQWNAPDENIQHDCNQVDFEWIRTQLNISGPAARACLLGSVVSPAWLSRIPKNPDHLCNCDCCERPFATWHHLAWDCPGIPQNDVQRPEKLSHFLGQRFGWPRKNLTDSRP